MNDLLHLSAGGLFALGMLGLGAHGYGKNRLNRETTGNEPFYLWCATLGPVVTTVAWCVAGALEVAARTLGP